MFDCKLKKGLIYLFVLSLLYLGACNPYQKLLKSSDYELKFVKAKEYYESEQYDKAIPLLEELMTVFRGSDKGEEVYYYFAKSNFGEEDYILSGYHLKNFVRTYPNSKYAEECLFLCALSYYLDSPRYTLDQSNTQLAIQEFQLFANQFPASEKITECNDYIDKLRLKLETKSFEIAKLYYNMENYRAAIVAFENTLKDYPNNTFREESVYLAFKASYLLAKNSIDTKKLERYKSSVEALYRYKDSYPSGKYIKEVESLGIRATNALSKLSSN